MADVEMGREGNAPRPTQGWRAMLRAQRPAHLSRSCIPELEQGMTRARAQMSWRSQTAGAINLVSIGNESRVGLRSEAAGRKCGGAQSMGGRREGPPQHRYKGCFI